MFFSKCFVRLFVIIEHNLSVLSRIVINLFVVAEARVVLKMFLLWAKYRGFVVFLFKKKTCTASRCNVFFKVTGSLRKPRYRT